MLNARCYCQHNLIFNFFWQYPLFSEIYHILATKESKREVPRGVPSIVLVHLRNECFFLSSSEMNRSAEQTNGVNREAVLVRFVCSALRFISHEPRKKDTHS